MFSGTRKYNAFLSYMSLDRVAQSEVSIIKTRGGRQYNIITDFILIYSCIPLFCLGLGIPMAS